MITIEILIHPQDDGEVMKVIEKSVIMATGLAMDKIDVDISISHWEPVPSEEEEKS